MYAEGGGVGREGGVVFGVGEEEGEGGGRGGEKEKKNEMILKLLVCLTYLDLYIYLNIIQLRYCIFPGSIYSNPSLRRACVPTYLPKVT